MMLREIKADLHIHSCLSPCGDLAMLPNAIVRQAKMRKLDIIGICDHNTAENVAAVKKAGEKEGLCVLAGMEIASREEVHVLGIFDDNASLKRTQDTVYENLLGQNDIKVFGEQVVVNENDQPVNIVDKLLIGATSLSIDKVVGLIRGLGGIVIASHVDREQFSIISQLGFISDNLSFDALELSPNYAPEKFGEYKSYGFPLVAFSDAHILQDIGKKFTRFWLEDCSFSEVKMAFGGIDGRRVEI